jgi:hypothetical protein
MLFIVLTKQCYLVWGMADDFTFLLRAMKDEHPVTMSLSLRDVDMEWFDQITATKRKEQEAVKRAERLMNITVMIKESSKPIECLESAETDVFRMKEIDERRHRFVHKWLQKEISSLAIINLS